MNAAELFLKDGRTAGVWYCGKCRIVHREESQAAKCCEPYKCDKCGEEVTRYWTRCEKCREVEETAKERASFEKADKVSVKEWAGWVYLEGTGDEGFHRSVSDFMDDWADNHEEGGTPPEYVWACKPIHFVRASLDDIYGGMEGEAYEDFDFESLNGLEQLKVALDKFNQANAAVCSYVPDYTKAILISR